MSEECRHSKISSQDFVTCEGCGFKVKDILAALQSDLAAARTQIALYLDDYEQLCALMHRRDKDLAAAREELERAREALIDIWARHPNFPLNGKTPREQAEAHYAREVAHAPKGEEG